MTKKKFIWEHHDWPRFKFDTSVGMTAAYNFEKLLIKSTASIAALNKELQINIAIEKLIDEAVNTSSIEGEKIDRESVRSSLKNRLIAPHATKYVSDKRAIGMSELMIDVRRNLKQPLSKEMLCLWQTFVLPGQGLFQQPLIGQYRHDESPMMIVSGPIGSEKIHFIAPPSHQVETEMARFIQWYNKTSPSSDTPNIHSMLARSAIAHLYFETIHPFEDGNGRVGRAISEHSIGQAINEMPLLSLSQAIEKDRDKYYHALETASRHTMDITPWIEYYIGLVELAQQLTQNSIDSVIEKTRYFDELKQYDLNERQLKVLRKLLDVEQNEQEINLTAKRYQNITKTSKATATRDLQLLVQVGAIYPLGKGGRSVAYNVNRKLAKSFELGEKIKGNINDYRPEM